MAPKLLWIGLGNMGRGMCKNIVEKGDFDGPLMIHNRSVKRAQDLSAKLPGGKTEVIESVAEGVPRADVIFTCLAHDEAVQEVYAAAVDSGDIKGKLFVDCSTIHPEATEALAKSVLEKGAEFVAAPVFGPPPAADAGALVGVLAGPSASVEKAKPWFKGVMSRQDIDLSDKPYGKASTLKVLGNTFVFNAVEQLAEAHVVAEKNGLGTDAVHDLMEVVFPGLNVGYSKRMLTGDYYKREEPLFSVDLARKDVRHALSLAKEAGTRMRNVELADEHFEAVQKEVGPKGDICGIYGAVRQEAGLPYANDV